MTLPNPFILAAEAKEHQRFLLEEAEALRLHRTDALRDDSAFHGRQARLRSRLGGLLIVAGEWLRGEDDRTAINRPRTPLSAS